MTRREGLAAAVLALAFCGAGPALFESEGGHFRVALPQWERRALAKEDDATEFGVAVFAPGGPGPRATITVDYYAPGNAFVIADRFLLRSRAASADRGRVSPVANARLGILAARRWTTRYSIRYPPARVFAGAIAMREDTVLAEAGGGFYVAKFSCPESDYGARSAAFDGVLASFRAIRLP